MTNMNTTCMLEAHHKLIMPWCWRRNGTNTKNFSPLFFLLLRNHVVHAKLWRKIHFDINVKESRGRIISFCFVLFELHSYICSMFVVAAGIGMTFVRIWWRGAYTVSTRLIYKFSYGFNSCCYCFDCFLALCACVCVSAQAFWSTNSQFLFRYFVSLLLARRCHFRHSVFTSFVVISLRRFATGSLALMMMIIVVIVSECHNISTSITSKFLPICLH